MNFCLISVFLTFSHVDYITSSAQCLRLYIISSLFLHQFLYLTPVDASLKYFFQPFAHNNCFLHSFVPSTISSWNSLPPNVTNALTLPAFKHLKHCIYMNFNFVNRVHLYIRTCYSCTLCSYA